MYSFTKYKASSEWLSGAQPDLILFWGQEDLLPLLERRCLLYVAKAEYSFYTASTAGACISERNSLYGPN